MISVLIMACSGKPPEIQRVFWQINLIDDREQNLVYPALSLFLQADDPDGFEDLEEIYLINDEEELFWRLDSTSWQKSGSEDEIWIGSNSISMPGGSPLPGGEYRVMLLDVGGDAAEQTIFLKDSDFKIERGLIPEITIDEEEIRVSGRADSYTLWVYGKDRQYQRSFALDQDRIGIQEIIAVNPAYNESFSFRVYSSFKETKSGIISGPYTVSPGGSRSSGPAQVSE